MSLPAVLIGTEMISPVHPLDRLQSYRNVPWHGSSASHAGRRGGHDAVRYSAFRGDYFALHHEVVQENGFHGIPKSRSVGTHCSVEPHRDFGSATEIGSR